MPEQDITEEKKQPSENTDLRLQFQQYSSSGFSLLKICQTKQPAMFFPLVKCKNGYDESFIRKILQWEVIGEKGCG